MIPPPFSVAVHEVKEKRPDETIDTDIVIVGGGGAGMTAAIEAANAGKKIVILESQGMAGGNSIRSTGGMNAGKTPEQDKNSFDEAAGVEKTLKTAEEKVRRQCDHHRTRGYRARTVGSLSGCAERLL